MPDSRDIIRQFFHAWGTTEQDLFTAMRTYLTPNAIWENVGLSLTTGPEEAIQFLGKYLAGARLATFAAEILHLSGDGDVVFVERVDRAVKLDGTLRTGHGVRVVGVFELRDGKITAWRDYFDTAPHTH